VTKSQCYSFLYLLWSSLVNNFHTSCRKTSQKTGRPDRKTCRKTGRPGRKTRKTRQKTGRPVGRLGRPVRRLGRPVGRPEDPESYKRRPETCSGFSFEAENRSVKIVCLQKRPAEDRRRIRLQRQRRCYTKLAVLLIAGCYNKEAAARIVSFKVVGSFCIKSWIESKSPSKSSCCILSDVRQQRRL